MSKVSEDLGESDETPDSDELAEIITKKRKAAYHQTSSSKQPRTISRPVHAISDSDSDSELEISSGKRTAANGKVQNFGTLEKNDRVGESSTLTSDDKPVCQYGVNCYRKNREHLEQFRHDDGPSGCVSDQLPSSFNIIPENKYGFFVTKVEGINKKFNHTNIAVGIQDLLSVMMGTLCASVQFSYMFDIPWLVRQYPPEFRSCPLMLVHGEQRESKKNLEKEASPFPNVRLCQAKLPILYGTHHTKMMLLLYQEGLRVVIHTANMIPNDWYQKTQGVWVSPVFPKCTADEIQDGDSLTNFKSDLLLYLKSYEIQDLQIWCNHVKQHNFSSAKVFLIGSVPGRHTETKKSLFGHLKLRKVLIKYGSDQASVDSAWPVVGQFSSIGSLGATAEDWLRGEWLTSLAARRGTISGNIQTRLKLIFPSVDDVRMSLEGYPAGANLPYSYKTALKQPYLRNFLHRWSSEVRGRTIASPHIKTYQRLSPDAKKMAWFMVTSANLSKAAWGMTEKKGEQLMIRSYELGVLFLPAFHECDGAFPLTGSSAFPVPYDVELKKYTEKDCTWVWDVPHIKAPDRHGNMWCPALK